MSSVAPSSSLAQRRRIDEAQELLRRRLRLPVHGEYLAVVEQVAGITARTLFRRAPSTVARCAVIFMDLPSNSRSPAMPAVRGQPSA